MASAGDPTASLPSPISTSSICALLRSIGLPQPISIDRPKVTAQYHSIYVLNFDIQALSAALEQAGLLNTANKSPGQLILRVAGQHLPKIKTENEAAVLTWLARNAPAVPVPTLVRYDSSTNNPLGYEYELMVKVHGVTLSDIYEELNADERHNILSQMVDIVAELHKHKFNHIGGFRFEGKAVVPGPVLEETFWQQPDIEESWKPYPEATISSLNIQGPYNNYVEYITAHFQRYIFAIKTHDSLCFMRDTIPRLEKFVKVINKSKHKDSLNKIKLGLAHKDLHFGNVMYDPESKKITAILDWEFSGVVPYPRWDPARAFLWSGEMTEEAKILQIEDKETLEDMARERGVAQILDDTKYTGKLQGNMQLAQNYLRAIVEVAPRGVKENNWIKWREAVLENIQAFDC